MLSAGRADITCVVCRDEIPPRYRDRGGRTCGKDCKRTLMSLLTMRPVVSRECAVCGATITRRFSEGPRQFDLRKSCSKRCAMILFRKKRMLPAPRHCVVCEQPFMRRPKEALVEFAVRKTCSTKCMGAYNSALAAKKRGVVLPRVCERCGQSLIRRRTEAVAVFQHRKYCSRRCRFPGPLVPRRDCVVCGTMLERNKGEPIVHFVKRSTCGTACGARAPRPLLWFEFHGAVLCRNELAMILQRTESTLCTRFPASAAIARCVIRPVRG